jgi:hypothetical protein
MVQHSGSAGLLQRDQLALRLSDVECNIIFYNIIQCNIIFYNINVGSAGLLQRDQLVRGLVQLRELRRQGRVHPHLKGVLFYIIRYILLYRLLCI